MYRDIGQIKAANKAAGKHFFDKGTMRHFRSQVYRTVYGGRYFVSSEQFVGYDGVAHPRQYTVREALESGSIISHGRYETHDAAVSAIKRLMAER